MGRGNRPRSTRHHHRCGRCHPGRGSSRHSSRRKATSSPCSRNAATSLPASAALRAWCSTRS
eukprot:5607924-Prymnesium_polylepis.1